MIGCIIQARTGSHRFYRKIYEDILGQNTLQRTLCGVSKSRLSDKIILAMPVKDEKEFLVRKNDNEFDNCTDDRFETFFGSEHDLMDRYYSAASKYGINTIIRVCADSPLIQGTLIDEMIEYYIHRKIDGLLSSFKVCSVSYPAGLAIEIFPLQMLEKAMSITDDIFDREHITPALCNEGTEFGVHGYENKKPHTVISTRFDDFSFDTPEDLELIKRITANYDRHLDLNRAILEA